MTTVGGKPYLTRPLRPWWSTACRQCSAARIAGWCMIQIVQRSHADLLSHLSPLGDLRLRQSLIAGKLAQALNHRPKNFPVRDIGVQHHRHDEIQFVRQAEASLAFSAVCRRTSRTLATGQFIVRKPTVSPAYS